MKTLRLRLLSTRTLALTVGLALAAALPVSSFAAEAPAASAENGKPARGGGKASRQHAEAKAAKEAADRAEAVREAERAARRAAKAKAQASASAAPVSAPAPAPASSAAPAAPAEFLQGGGRKAGGAHARAKAAKQAADAAEAARNAE